MAKGLIRGPIAETFDIWQAYQGILRGAFLGPIRWPSWQAIEGYIRSTSFGVPIGRPFEGPISRHIEEPIRRVYQGALWGEISLPLL